VVKLGDLKMLPSRPLLHKFFFLPKNPLSSSTHRARTRVPRHFGPVRPTKTYIVTAKGGDGTGWFAMTRPPPWMYSARSPTALDVAELLKALGLRGKRQPRQRDFFMLRMDFFRAVQRESDAQSRIFKFSSQVVSKGCCVNGRG